VIAQRSHPIIKTFEQTGNLSGRTVTIETPNQIASCHCSIIPSSLINQIERIRQDQHAEIVPIHITHDAERYERFRQQRNQPGSTIRSLVELERMGLSTTRKPTARPRPIMNVYSAQNQELTDEQLPGIFMLSNKAKQIPDQKLPPDQTAEVTLTNTNYAYTCFWQSFGQYGITGNGEPYISTIHYGQDFENAFFNGWQFIYGDGSDLFESFAEFLSVVSHELWHGVTGSRLNYFNEAGALNEHLSDVFASIAIQFTNQQTVDKGSWLIAKGIFKGYPNDALRSMKEPGKAYDIQLGETVIKDEQPDHYQQRYEGSEDNGGVHINSGIPNKAFYLFATSVGGNVWEKPGLIWYHTLKNGLLKKNATMQQFAEATIQITHQLYSTDLELQNHLLRAWREVGVLI
jgi:Zn-dependent metalloprotease